MSWKKVKLGSILTESKIVSKNPDTNKRIKVRLKVLGVEKRGIETEVEGATKQFIRKKGQFIYGKQNFHKGAFGIVPPELDGFESSSDLPAFDVDKSCLPEFLFYFFKQGNYYLELSKIASGVATQRINTSQLFDLEIPLPEIEIQKQLLSNIKILENNGGEVSKELTNQLDLIKQLRQAFLREAMQGKLVPSNNVKETGQKLLAKIKAEKAKLIAEKKLKKEKELPVIKEDEIKFKIPKHWTWCRLGEICTKIGSGSTPKGSNYSEIGKPFFRSQNIYDHELIYDDIKFISDKVQKQMNGTVVLSNDILLNITGGSMGRCALVPIDFDEGNVSQHVCIIRPLSLNNTFIHKLILSPYFQHLIFSSTTGGGREGLPKYNLEQFIIPIPPLHEQEKIVTKLKELMTYCDNLEQNIKEAQRYNEMLFQQVLSEAFGLKAVVIREEKKEVKSIIKKFYSDSNEIFTTLNMKIVEILKTANEPIPANVVWNSSEFSGDIELFYAELKKLIDIEKVVVEEKIGMESYLKLASYEN